jgi:hypothetical protein
MTIVTMTIVTMTIVTMTIVTMTIVTMTIVTMKSEEARNSWRDMLDIALTRSPATPRRVVSD